MSQPVSKNELIEAMESARNILDSLIDQIERSTMTLPGVSGEWSVKDILAHLTAYDRWLALTLAFRGQNLQTFGLRILPLMNPIVTCSRKTVIYHSTKCFSNTEKSGGRF